MSRIVPVLFFSLFFLETQSNAQILADTLPSRVLDAAIIKSYKLSDITRPLNDVEGTYLIGGRKSEVLPVQELSANIAEKTGRQIFSRLPGAFVYDMDGSGNQINIGTRGLDPHRSWEFNVRQNGIMINSDIYGYPASHYSPPMEAIKNIEVIRGTASLQYGAEFGGMINYVIKSPDTTRSFSLESMVSAGSFGLLSSYNAIGGKVGKLIYYAYHHRRVSDGYRDNGRSSAQAQYAGFTYALHPSLELRAEIGRSQYRYQIPGPLTDSMFHDNPRQSTRFRNFFSPDIYVPSLSLSWKMDSRTTLQAIASGVFGNRSSVEFEGFADRPDVIDPVTHEYKNRVVNIDNFNSRTAELRILHRYQAGSLRNVLSSGMMYFNNNMHRRQQGVGTTGLDYDLDITGSFGRDLRYKSESISFFLENQINITPALSVTPGFRYESGSTIMDGYISYLDPENIPNLIKHRIPLPGIHAQWLINEKHRLYGGISQAYRPVLFKDIIPGSTLERANKDLKNAYGYNAELGVRGDWKNRIKYDLTVFRILYQNRLGNLILNDGNGDYIYKTNIGDSQTTGVEIFAEGYPVMTRTFLISLFTSTSIMKAAYKNAQIASGGENLDISGNEVESVPRLISRNGLNISYKTWKMTFLYSYVSQTYSDPGNTTEPTTNGARGLVPSYGLVDLNMSLRVQPHIMIRAGVNNLLDKQYFTKRPLFYPGPGIWPSDGRNIVVTLTLKI